MKTDGALADPSCDQGRLPGHLHEHAQDRVGKPDQFLAADGGSAGDLESRPQVVPAFAAFHEPELGERSQVPVDRRHGRFKDRPELVSSDLAPIGDGQEDPQAAGE